ncbi:MAG: 23S rRNA (uracil-5-)-methyltransferase RumA [Nitrospinae bacterium RIFCSPLOWO2_02_39_17]|nr:MAG: 23S rRNA (uracil-5-)-methyltransferase RumA [Nitrospinae bacterium RIFCSPLOWO2_02_39_17]
MAKIKFKIPVKCGEKFELSVEDIASSGDGISHYKGYTLFVPQTVKGDRVFVEVIKTTPRFGITKIIKLLKPSTWRINPECPIYFECGGCQLQHIKYDEQMEFKKKAVKDSLERIGKIKLEFESEIIPARQPFFYRNKGIFHFKRTRKGLKVGFFAKGTHNVVDIKNCPVLLEPINKIKEAIRRSIENKNVSVYNELYHKGFLRSLIIRQSAKTKEILIGLVTTEGNFDSSFIQDIAEINVTLKGNYKLVGIVQNINTLKTNVILGTENRLLWGRDYLNESLGGINYQLSLTSFFQINPYQTETLLKTVEEMLTGVKGTILDTYSGIGSISLYLAKNSVSPIIGIEENEVAIEDAKKSAERNGIKNCSFLAGTTEKHLKNFEGSSDTKAIILDPPRKGCSEEVLNSVLKIKPERIVYVSCNPSTLSRDLNKLCQEVYCIKDVKVIDMFPQTVHMETVVLLEKREINKKIGR